MTRNPSPATLSKFYESDAALQDAKTRWAELSDLELEYDNRMRALVEALSPDDRERLVRDAAMFTTTNCGWFEYHAMQRAAAEARWRVRRDAESTAVPE